jgi:prepilin-type N-terminal cleavage/methylation domain-containing protein
MKNKGFSLIEVIVAVAILTLLMAPILVQVSKTLSNSAAAKERQYAVENAEF